jgi:hypothetical protein
LAKTFEDQDFYQVECENLTEEVIRDSNTFVGFMQKFVYHLLGIEDDLLGYLGLNPRTIKKQVDDSDEEFDD